MIQLPDGLTDGGMDKIKLAHKLPFQPFGANATSAEVTNNI